VQVEAVGEAGRVRDPVRGHHLLLQPGPGIRLTHWDTGRDTTHDTRGSGWNRMEVEWDSFNRISTVAKAYNLCKFYIFILSGYFTYSDHCLETHTHTRTHAHAHTRQTTHTCPGDRERLVGGLLVLLGRAVHLNTRILSADWLLVVLIFTLLFRPLLARRIYKSREESNRVE